MESFKTVAADPCHRIKLEVSPTVRQAKAALKAAIVDENGKHNSEHDQVAAAGVGIKAEKELETGLKVKRRKMRQIPVVMTHAMAEIFKAEPAHVKFASLLHKTPAPSNKLETSPIKATSDVKIKLRKLFSATECVVHFKLNKEYHVALKSVMKPIENICSFDFKNSDFACLFTVYPQFYSARYSKHTNDIFLSLPEALGFNGLNLAAIAGTRSDEFDLALKQVNQEDIVPDAHFMQLVRLCEGSTLLPSPPPTSTQAKTSTDSAHLDSPTPKLSLLEKIALKEQKRKQLIAEKKDLPSLRIKALHSRLPKIALAIDSHLLNMRKKSMYIGETIKMLMSGLRSPISKDECTEALQLLKEAVPQWLSVNTNEFGTLVSINDNVLQTEILASIEAKRVALFE